MLTITLLILLQTPQILPEVKDYIANHPKYGSIVYVEEPDTSTKVTKQRVYTTVGIYTINMIDGYIVGLKDENPKPYIPLNPIKPIQPKPFSQDNEFEIGKIGTIPQQVKVVQVIEDCVLISTRGKIVEIGGLKSSGITDNSYIRIAAPLKVIATDTYDTVMGGTSTVFMLVPTEPCTPTTAGPPPDRRGAGKARFR